MNFEFFAMASGASWWVAPVLLLASYGILADNPSLNAPWRIPSLAVGISAGLAGLAIGAIQIGQHYGYIEPHRKHYSEVFTPEEMASLDKDYRLELTQENREDLGDIRYNYLMDTYYKAIPIVAVMGIGQTHSDQEIDAAKDTIDQAKREYPACELAQLGLEPDHDLYSDTVTCKEEVVMMLAELYADLHIERTSAANDSAQ